MDKCSTYINAFKSPVYGMASYSKQEKVKPLIDRYTAAIIQFRRIDPEEIPDVVERRKANLKKCLLKVVPRIVQELCKRSMTFECKKIAK